jgi:hypothetical protein
MQLQYCPPPQVRRFWSSEHIPISNQSILTCIGTGGKILDKQLLSSSPSEEVLELAEDRRDS